jgi:hypothetical protein
MKFTGTQFMFGKAEVFINSIDTDNAMLSASVKIPLLNGNLWIRIHKAKTWSDSRKMSIEVEWMENDPPKPDEPDEYDVMFGEEGDNEDTSGGDEE